MNIDPSMGSGHILVYAFDVLYQIYEELGYSKREAVISIIQNNIYGMDIDDRAGTLANFAILMKAREYFPRIFTVLENEGIELNTLSIQESNVLGEGFISKIQEEKFEELLKVIELFNDAKEYGSILKVEGIDLEKVQRELIEFEEKEKFFYTQEKELLRILIKQAKIMSQKYDVTVTNPPYMGTKGYSEKLKKYVESNFKDSKSDMFAVFIEKCMEMTKENRYTSMITMQSWMFLSSYEKLRNLIVDTREIDTLVHLGARAFVEIGGEVVQTVAWTMKNIKANKKNTYIRLTDYNNADEKEKQFKNKENYYTTSQQDFHKIPGSPIAYWVSDRVKEIFATSEKLGDVGDAKQGLATADNNRFLRLWMEVSLEKTKFDAKNNVEALESGKKWFPYNKGGEKRRWYGNQEYLVNWENDGYEIKNFKDDKGKVRSRPQNIRYYFKKGMTFSTISSNKISFRFLNNSIFGGGGSGVFTEKNFYYIFSFINSKIIEALLKITNPTINFLVGDLLNIPLLISDENTIEKITENCVEISKSEWDSRETSWDFGKNQLIIENEKWKIVGVLPLANPNESEKIGFSNGKPLQTNESIDENIRHQIANPRYTPDIDGIIPVTDTNYFAGQDIVERFEEFLVAVYGRDSLEDNLNFIGKAIKDSNNDAREILREYFMGDFYADHLQRYSKRPIYWLVSSNNKGKGATFNAYIYLHRYNKNTIPTIRGKYVNELQAKLKFKEEGVEKRLLEDDLNAREKKELKGEKDKYRKQINELLEFDKKLNALSNQMIELDLDDGVKVNYEKLADILYKVKM